MIYSISDKKKKFKTECKVGSNNETDSNIEKEIIEGSSTKTDKINVDLSATLSDIESNDFFQGYKGENSINEIQSEKIHDKNVKQWQKTKIDNLSDREDKELVKNKKMSLVYGKNVFSESDNDSIKLLNSKKFSQHRKINNKRIFSRELMNEKQKVIPITQEYSFITANNCDQYALFRSNQEVSNALLVASRQKNNIWQRKKKFSNSFTFLESKLGTPSDESVESNRSVFKNNTKTSQRSAQTSANSLLDKISSNQSLIMAKKVNFFKHFTQKLFLFSSKKRSSISDQNENLFDYKSLLHSYQKDAKTSSLSNINFLFSNLRNKKKKTLKNISENRYYVNFDLLRVISPCQSVLSIDNYI